MLLTSCPFFFNPTLTSKNQCSPSEMTVHSPLLNGSQTSHSARGYTRAKLLPRSWEWSRPTRVSTPRFTRATKMYHKTSKIIYIINIILYSLHACTRTHARTHARAHARTHARARARTHAHTHTHTHTHTRERGGGLGVVDS